MSRVAANQDRALAERSRYTYVQHADVATRKGKRALCREVTDSRVTPSGTGSSQELISLAGTLWQTDHYITYDHLLKDVKTGEVRMPGTDTAEVNSERAASGPAAPSESQPPVRTGGNKAGGDTGAAHGNSDGKIDVDLVEDLRRSLTNASSKDGFEAGLFPLTVKAAGGYTYRLEKRETMNGRDTWRIHFKPRKDADDADWEGDAWIDTAAYQPVLVRTRLAHQVPFLVKTMLGTNLPGLGFSATYAPQPDGVWFPTSFGTEFKVHVLFFFSRTIVMDIQNRDFQKTHTESHILDAAE